MDFSNTDIREDFVIREYIKGNDVIGGAERMAEYYAAHSPLTREEALAYISEKLTVGAVVDMMAAAGAGVLAAGHAEPVATGVPPETADSPAQCVPAPSGVDLSGTRLCDFSVSYLNFADTDRFKAGGYVFTKKCPDLGGDDVFACYLIGKGKKEIVDLMFVNVGLRLKRYDDGDTYSKIISAYRGFISKHKGMGISVSRMNNAARKRTFVTDPFTGNTWRGVSEAAAALGLEKRDVRRMASNGRLVMKKL